MLQSQPVLHKKVLTEAIKDHKPYNRVNFNIK